MEARIKELMKGAWIGLSSGDALQQIALRSVHLARFDAFCREHRCPLQAHRRELHARVQELIGRDQAVDYLEFGVYEGTSLRWWLQGNRHPESRFVGFDTFEGLPEDWTHELRKGAFSTQGSIPEVDDPRCSFEVGLFRSTLPRFLRRFVRKRPAVLHLDADLYSSTLLVLVHCLPWMRRGDVLVFDEFHDYMDEYRALEDARAASPVELEAIAATEGYGGRGYGRVALRVL